MEAAESGASPAEQESSQQKSVEKEEEIFVSDEEKKEAEAKASTFVAALERCMFDTYAELACGVSSLDLSMCSGSRTKWLVPIPILD